VSAGADPGVCPIIRPPPGFAIAPPSNLQFAILNLQFAISLSSPTIA
jgi:hypothetical protein